MRAIPATGEVKRFPTIDKIPGNCAAHTHRVGGANVQTLGKLGHNQPEKRPASRFAKTPCFGRTGVRRRPALPPPGIYSARTL